MPKFKTFLLLFLLIQLFLPINNAFADTGPKPTMEFTFKQELSGETASITSGILYECEQPNCSDAAPLQQLGPQGFSCDGLSCSARAYGFSQYHKLEIQFSDGKTRQSNVFKTAGFDSKYTVTIQSDDLLVETHFSLVPSFSIGSIEIIACLCGLASVALIVGLIVFFVRRSRRK